MRGAKLPRASAQIHVLVCLSTGVNTGKCCSGSPSFRAGARPDRLWTGCSGGRRGVGSPTMRAGTQLGPVVRRMQRW